MLALIATDGSDASLAAARFALEHLPHETRYTVVAVAPLPEDPGADAGGFEGPLLDPKTADELEHDAVGHALDAITRTTAVLAPHPTDEKVVRGEIGSSVVTVADEIDATLVVVGSRGRGTLSRIFLGSVSDHVVHHSTRPVLVVPFAEDADADG